MRSSRSHFGQRRGQIVRANSAHDAKQGGKRSRRFHNVICLFRILVSKGVPSQLLRMRGLIIFSREAETPFRNDS